MCHNLATPTTNHKNKGESARLVDGYYVVRVTNIPNSKIGVLINIISIRISHTMSQLVTCRIVYALPLQKCHLNL